jgi:hypothetical protein
MKPVKSKFSEDSPQPPRGQCGLRVGYTSYYPYVRRLHHLDLTEKAVWAT